MLYYKNQINFLFFCLSVSINDLRATGSTEREKIVLDAIYGFNNENHVRLYFFLPFIKQVHTVRPWESKFCMELVLDLKEVKAMLARPKKPLGGSPQFGQKEPFGCFTV